LINNIFETISNSNVTENEISPRKASNNFEDISSTQVPDSVIEAFSMIPSLTSKAGSIKTGQNE
jgi:hypothetical protein